MGHKVRFGLLYLNVIARYNGFIDISNVNGIYPFGPLGSNVMHTAKEGVVESQELREDSTEH